MALKLGVIALQGGFAEHIHMFHNIEEMHIECSEIRNKKDLLSHEWDGIVLPGGESTTMGKLLVELDMFFHTKGNDSWGYTNSCYMCRNDSSG